MSGSIKRLGRGSRTVVVNLGPDPVTRKRRQLSKAVHGTKRDAEAFLVQVLHERDTGVERPVGRLTVGAYLERWLEDYGRTNLAQKTLATYRDAVRVHLTPALGSLDLVALRPTHIQSLYSRLLISGRRDGRCRVARRAPTTTGRSASTRRSGVPRW